MSICVHLWLGACAVTLVGEEASAPLTNDATSDVVAALTLVVSNAQAVADGLAPEPVGTNEMPVGVVEAMSPAQLLEHLRGRLEEARHLRHVRQPGAAERILVGLLTENPPDSVQQPALLELAMAARDQAQFPRAQQIYAQFLTRWPNDLQVPEILLRQGQLFRQMGLNSLALAKFYAVMTSSLVLKNDTLEYYQRLVLSAQTEIAETHYQLGKYAESADFYSRLLKQNNPALDRAAAQFRLIRSAAALGRNDETVTQSEDFLAHYPGAPEQPEVRFYLASALKQLNRNNEALGQVLTLLKEQKANTESRPELWAYWQQRAGNEVANQLYREGDYPKALDIYLSLAQLDRHATWQLPVNYQIGLTYERLAQPERARQIYLDILQREGELGTNASPGLKAVLDMARWRVSFVEWRGKAENNRAPASPQPNAAVAPESLRRPGEGAPQPSKS